MPIKTTEVSLSFSVDEIKKLIVDSLVREKQIESGKDVNVSFEIGEGPGDPMDRFPGPTILKKVTVTVKS